MHNQMSMWTGTVEASPAHGTSRKFQDSGISRRCVPTTVTCHGRTSTQIAQCRGQQKRTVRLLHDQRHLLALNEDTSGTIRDLSDPLQVVMQCTWLAHVSRYIWLQVHEGHSMCSCQSVSWLSIFQPADTIAKQPWLKVASIAT